LKIAKLAAAPSSIQILLLEQIKMLQREGHEVVAICAPGLIVDDIRCQGVPVKTIRISRELEPLTDVQTLRELVALFKEHHFDVVHTHTPKAGLLGPLAARLAGVPKIVHTIHGLLFHKDMSVLRQRFYWLPEKWTASLSTHLLSQSREDIDVAVETGLCSRRKIEYLGNGIDVEKFNPQLFDGSVMRQRLGIPLDAFVVGCVGRLVFEKGFRELFAAAEQLTADPQLRNLRFVVVGQEEPEQNDAVNHSMIETLQLRGIVQFLGSRNDMPDIYSTMDIFLLPSYREGIPRACMEAAAMELPVIATNIRGNREVVLDGVSGLLIPVRDVSAIVNRIRDLYSRQNLLPAMGMQGRQHVVSHFSQSGMLLRLRDFYRRLDHETVAGTEA
jgi:glycosyltransferase involved in cell wall biosynthesis